MHAAQSTESDRFTGSAGPTQTYLEASVSADLNHGHNLTLNSIITSMLTDYFIVLAFNGEVMPFHYVCYPSAPSPYGEGSLLSQVQF